jgi:excisionase family DNA binding protein
MSASTEGTLLTLREVATHYRVSVSTVRRWVAAGQLASVRTPGGYPRVPAAALSSAEKTGPAEPPSAVADNPAGGGDPRFP